MVYEQISGTIRFANFDIQYYDFPLEDLLQRKIKEGGKPTDLISKSDGFHPN